MSVVKDTDALAQYQTMRETLVFLTHLNYEDTESIMLEKLAAQVDGTQWTWRNLNTLCWAFGSISGAMNEDGKYSNAKRACNRVYGSTVVIVIVIFMT